MQETEVSLPRGWFTPGSHEEFWPPGGTYGLIPFDCLPELDGEWQEGQFAWLPVPPSDEEPLKFEQFEGDVGETLRSLERDAEAFGAQVPETFVSFMSTPAIHTRIQTSTACYLSLSRRLIEVDRYPGARLLRFMNDQQCVLLWYLYLQPGKPPSVVLADPLWHDEASGDTLDDIITPTKLTICADSFEEFIYRFWIENAIWFALYENRPLTETQEAYRQAAASWRPPEADTL